MFLNPSSSESPPSTSSPNPSENGDCSDNFSEISTLDGDELNEDLLLENKCFQELETQKSFAQDHLQDDLVVYDIEEVVKALVGNSLDEDTGMRVKQYENELNSSKVGWMRLSLETDLKVLTSLLFEWLEGLKVPILQVKHFEDIVIMYKQPEECFQKFGLVRAQLN